MADDEEPTSELEEKKAANKEVKEAEKKLARTVHLQAITHAALGKD